jgi:hypothetical protein
MDRCVPTPLAAAKPQEFGRICHDIGSPSRERLVLRFAWTTAEP